MEFSTANFPPLAALRLACCIGLVARVSIYDRCLGFLYLASRLHKRREPLPQQASIVADIPSPSGCEQLT